MKIRSNLKHIWLAVGVISMVLARLSLVRIRIAKFAKHYSGAECDYVFTFNSLQRFRDSGHCFGVLFYGNKPDGCERNLFEHDLSFRYRNDAMVLDREVLVAHGTAISVA